MVFDGKQGNFPAHGFISIVTIIRKDKSKPPRASSDYEVVVNKFVCPARVEIIDLA